MGKQQSKNARMSGGMKEWELDYSLKSQPVIAVGKKGGADNELLSARGLAIYEPNQLIYIADFGNWRIQVVTFEGNFVTNFGKGILRRPYGVAVTEDHVFVTNYYYQLFQFSDFNVARTDATRSGEGLLTHPRGLCIDYNGDVYVAENINHRVCIYSNELKYINYLGTQQLNYPRDVKVTPNSIVVLDGSPNCVHFFSRNGHLINSCVTQWWSHMACMPYFFSLDPAGNILITHHSRDEIKILSPSGGLIHAISGRRYVTMISADLGIHLVKIQNDLSKLRQAIHHGTHTDGTPINIKEIESAVERTQLRVSKVIEKASKDKNTQVTTLPFLRPSRSLSPERIQALLRDTVSQPKPRSKTGALSLRAPGRLEPIKSLDSERVFNRKIKKFSDKLNPKGNVSSML
ncbi:RING finger protein nhl-1 isoform X3 [Oopsacas minuta]|uniref:RING finger protein nhl-1 isoform X3 n=1 Tax=Oopsacas minuta TaxID=111878 RepID=A0AAV7KEU1_9METZ|nr:RING finger protein nhl-1 isoform X3 [Oopsacas minuta]